MSDEAKPGSIINTLFTNQPSFTTKVITRFLGKSLAAPRLDKCKKYKI